MKESFDSATPKRPLRWHISDEELIGMAPEEQARYINEKVTRLYEAMMLNVDSADSTKPVTYEDVDHILHPEKIDDKLDQIE